MIVMKFGGSSLKDAERITQAAHIIRHHISQQPLIVLSAFGKTTDELISLGHAALRGSVAPDKLQSNHENICNQLGISVPELSLLMSELRELLKGITLIKELSRKTTDYLVSFGERFAVRVVSAFLNSIELPSQPFDAWDLGFVTDSRFNDAEVQEISYGQIRSWHESFAPKKSLAIVTGFIAKDRQGSITTLGRGGSDLTASVLGAAVGASEIQVWKDVDGILTSDPKLVPSARSVVSVSFEEAAELAYFGAKVLHPLSVQPAMQQNIPVRVKNSYNPDHPGTLIIATPTQSGELVKAITCKREVTLIDIVSTRMLGQHGFLASVFQIFNEHEISVDMVATSEVSVSVTLDEDLPLDGALRKLSEFARVEVALKKAIVSLIGDVERSSEILEAAFNVFLRNGINVQMISQGASKVNIGLIVEDSEVERCVKALHKHFLEAK